MHLNYLINTNLSFKKNLYSIVMEISHSRTAFKVCVLDALTGEGHAWRWSPHKTTCS
jgi:hypothetical protein